MNCPVCEADCERENLLVPRQVGESYACRACGFHFIGDRGVFIKPRFLKGHSYICPACRKETPSIVTLPVIPDILGLECKSCERVLCYWKGGGDYPLALESFDFVDVLPDFQNYDSPVDFVSQKILVEILFDAVPVPLPEAVRLMSACLSQSGLLSKRIINRKIREAESEREAEEVAEEREAKKKERATKREAKKVAPDEPVEEAPPKKKGKKKKKKKSGKTSGKKKKKRVEKPPLPQNPQANLPMDGGQTTGDSGGHTASFGG